MIVRNRLSLIVVFVVSIVLVFYRFSYPEDKDQPLKVTTWDAMGYYMYWPSFYIYEDATQLNWVKEIDSTYNLTGGALYQAHVHTNGNYVYKYLGGVALLQTPFFFAGHAVAKLTDYPADGFSAPYQYAIAFGAIFYVILALFLLRKVLLRYYDDRFVGITILLLALASNFIQYVSIDSAQSHAYIFPLYVLVLYTTIKWHESPKIKWAALTGLIIGVATISRPTEAIMLFIPLLWGTQTKDAKKEKWQLVKQNRKHVIFAVLFGLIGILPQLIYWKYASGSFIYDVGSSWRFLTPFFRVLFGFENGWFIYTPITTFFVLGFFFIRKFPFMRSVIVFCLLNIWIIIAWADWKYGATYSTRAMVQSYPVFALAFAGFVKWIEQFKWKYLFYLAGVYLVFVNLFQIGQYNKTILHYRDMNRLFYGRIYLNPDPTPLDMSLLDNDEVLNDQSSYKKETIFSLDSMNHVSGNPADSAVLVSKDLLIEKGGWITVEANIKAKSGYNGPYIHGEIVVGNETKTSEIRLNNAISIEGKSNPYAFHMKLPEQSKRAHLRIYISSWQNFELEVSDLYVTYLKE